ncbi:MAG: DNA-3-methyladenine glycosylase I [Candidatus Colwellbacteria bacterium]|nr:DNA-3-methyladenine glycosylase I [Candidatus Colwellbacteria bacterium]
MKKRCDWAGGNPLLREYHDKEWGGIIKDDRKLFEFLVLESAQAGLNWLTVLRKRENYRKAYVNFDPKKVAKFGRREINKLLKDAGIIRNRQKIEASINNAARFLEIQKEFGSFFKYSWGFVKSKQIKHTLRKNSDYPTVIPEAIEFAADLKKRGFKFLGPTIIYAHMQAVGMVDDHMVHCFRRSS